MAFQWMVTGVNLDHGVTVLKNVVVEYSKDRDLVIALHLLMVVYHVLV